MLVWLLVLLLLFGLMYTVYHLDYGPYKNETQEDDEHNYTIKL